MLSVRVERDTTAPAELVLDTLRDPAPERRGEFWSNISPKRFTLHDSGHRRGPKGRIIAAAVNHLGGRRLFGWYLGTVVKKLERRIAASER